MKKLLLLVVALTVCATGAYAEMTWSPTPLVIDVPDWIQYDFEGTPIDITFDTSGKSATVWLVIESKLGEDKPVAVQNGYKNWHYVDGIDTTIYVSTSKVVDPGSGNYITWEGYGNEKEFDLLQTNAELVPSGTYTYYVWGYDHLSDREIAIDFISIGAYWEGQYARFYVNQPDGTPYETPMLMGQVCTNVLGAGSDTIGRADIYKWQMGNEPSDRTLAVVSDVVEFDEVFSDISSSARQGNGPGMFDPEDHTIFYFTKNRYWDKNQTMVKYTFVPGGQAEQDLDWGDYANYLEYTHPGNKTNDTVRPSIMTWDTNKLVVLDGGQNPLTYPHDKFRIHDKEDPFLEYWNDQIDEFYMPMQPDYSGAQRTASEINRFNWGPGEDTVIVTGDWSCLTECLNLNRFMAGATEPYAEDGYVTWANSNGDFFLDMSANADQIPAEHPEQLWACIVSDPRVPNNPREETTDADMNGFVISYLEFTGLTSFAIYCPDGSGIEQAKFNDDAVSTATSEQKKGGGELLDYGGTYDGLYMQAAISEDYGNLNSYYQKTCYVAFDSDSGTISIDVGPVVEDDVPAVFTVAQNSPNPFNPTTTITYNLALNGQVTIDVYNVAGQKVDTLVNDYMTAGSHSVVWDASDLAAGTYFYTVKSGNYTDTKKMTLLK